MERNGSTPRKAWSILIAALVLLAVVLWLVWAPPQQPIGPIAGANARPERALKIGDDAPHSNVGALTSDEVQRKDVPDDKATAWRFLVVDEAGEPIPNAGCYVLQENEVRRVFAGTAGVIGTSRADGRIEVPLRELPPGCALVFSHSSYKPAVVPCQGITTDQVVVLAEGYTQAFRCVDRSGRPVDACTILMSGTVLPADGSAAFSDGTSPGWPPSAAIRTASTDPNGITSVRGLEAGHYRFRCEKAGYTPVEGSHGVSATVPGPTVEIVLAPVFAFMVAVTGDEPIGHSFTFDEHWKADGVPGTMLQRIREDLETLYPGCLIATAASMDMPAGSTVPLRVALKNGEMKLVDVPGFPLEAGAVPLVIDCPETPGSDRALVRLQINDASGTTVDPGGMYVLEGGNNLITGVQIASGANGEMWLRPGEYALRCRWPLLKGRYQPSKISVVQNPAALEVHVRLDVDVRRCTLEYELPWGETASEVYWQLADGNAHHSFGRVRPDPLEILLPVGFLQIRAKTPGISEVSLELDVPSEPWDETFRIVVLDQ